MIAEALQKFADLIKTEVHATADGRPLSSRPLHNLPLPDEPVYPTLEVMSLDGLASFVAGANLSDAVIRCKAQSVEVLSAEFGVRRQRNVYARAICKVEPFNFGHFVDMEQFRIGLLTRFVINDDLEKILEFSAKLTAESASSLTDNGVSQSVTARVGIATSAQVDVPSPCRLRPVRTFREIDQPEGVFVFRMRKGAGGGIEAALFEHFTDWERNAALGVAQYLREQYSAQIGIIAVLA